MLPIMHTSFGNSPYSAVSSFAGNPFFIDLDLLTDDGLLDESDYKFLLSINVKIYTISSDLKTIYLLVTDDAIPHLFFGHLHNSLAVPELQSKASVSKIQAVYCKKVTHNVLSFRAAALKHFYYMYKL